MGILDTRANALAIINEVRVKSKLNPATSFTFDSDSLTKLYYLNDVISEVADYGDWQELLQEVTVTVRSSVSNYSVPVSAVHHIHEIAYSGRPAAMRLVDLDTIRQLSRINTYGAPTQWGIVGVDVDGNPNIRVSPIPTTAYASGYNFNMLIYTKPTFIATADVSVIPVFPSDLLVQGLLCKTVLDESDGEPTARYQALKKDYDDMLDETYNRFNGDSGSTVYMRPSRGRR